MTRSEFLKELRQALENDLSGSIIQENLSFYDQYITGEVQNGKSEEEVLQMLGDPWVLARTVIDAQNGTDKETVHEAGGNKHAGHEHKKEQPDNQNRGSQFHILGLDVWWKKLLLVLAIVMIIAVIFSIITGVIRLLAPIVIPVLIVIIIVRAIGNRKR